MVFKEKIDIKSNGTHLIVGEINQLIMPENILKPDGFVDLAAVNTLASSGTDAYYTIEMLARYQYAKPNQESKTISND